MFKVLLPLTLAACSSDDDDNDDAPVAEAPAGEDEGAGGETPDAGGSSYQITFSNRSTSQPMTPPVVAIHDPEVRVYEAGVAENGQTNGLRDQLAGLVGSGVASTGMAFVNPAEPGPILPGESANLTLTSDSDTQVLSFVSMIVCTNDGFTGFDSRALSAGVETVFATNYDAGTEVNTLTADYWVPPCGTETNLHEDENGVIAPHPGQEPTGDDAARAFAAGAELMEVVITRN